MSKDKGWKFLNSDNDINSFDDEDGSWGYKSEDGSESYTGADGSWGYKNSDGSLFYTGADGSWGYRNTDGSGSFYSADGESVFYSSDDSNEIVSYDENNEEEYTEESTISPLTELLVGAGMVGIVGILAAKSAKEERLQKERIYRAEQEIKEAKARKIKAEARKIEEEQEAIEKEKIIVKRKERNQHILQFAKRHYKLIIICILLMGVSVGVLYAVFDYKRQIPISFASKDLINMNYGQVEDIFEREGFESIDLIPLEDLINNKQNQDGLVESVYIKNVSEFNQGDRFYPEDLITIQYHSIKKVYLSFDNSDVKGKDYNNILKQLKDKGFTNITIKPIYDVIFGLFTKDGEVEKIIINGSDDFYGYDKFELESEIIIEYHTYRKNKY